MCSSALCNWEETCTEFVWKHELIEFEKLQLFYWYPDELTVVTLHKKPFTHSVRVYKFENLSSSMSKVKSSSEAHGTERRTIRWPVAVPVASEEALVSVSADSSVVVVVLDLTGKRLFSNMAFLFGPFGEIGRANRLVLCGIRILSWAAIFSKAVLAVFSLTMMVSLDFSWSAKFGNSAVTSAAVLAASVASVVVVLTRSRGLGLRPSAGSQVVAISSRIQIFIFQILQD